MSIAKWLDRRRALFDGLSFTLKTLVVVLMILLVDPFASALGGIGLEPRSSILHAALAGLLGGAFIGLSSHLLTGLVARKPHLETDRR